MIFSDRFLWIRLEIKQFSDPREKSIYYMFSTFVFVLLVKNVTKYFRILYYSVSQPVVHRSSIWNHCNLFNIFFKHVFNHTFPDTWEETNGGKGANSSLLWTHKPQAFRKLKLNAVFAIQCMMAQIQHWIFLLLLFFFLKELGDSSCIFWCKCSMGK